MKFTETANGERRTATLNGDKEGIRRTVAVAVYPLRHVTA